MQFDRFICPVCGRALQDAGHSLCCESGHSFDKARQGYANLLPVQQKHSLEPGDDRAMVSARQRFLAGGWYAPFKDVLCSLAEEYTQGTEHPFLVDAGCGEGYYTAALWDMLQKKQGAAICAFDISKFAVKAAAGQHKGIDFAVASAYAVPLPDHCADVVTNVFSPMAEKEFRRIVKPGGVLLFAVPSARHLWGLKQVLYDSPYENEEKDVDYPGFVCERRIPVRATVTFTDAQAIEDLFAMTPYAWKTGSEGKHRLQEVRELTTEIGFDFLVYRAEEDEA